MGEFFLFLNAESSLLLWHRVEWLNCERVQSYLKHSSIVSNWSNNQQYDYAFAFIEFSSCCIESTPRCEWAWRIRKNFKWTNANSSRLEDAIQKSSIFSCSSGQHPPDQIVSWFDIIRFLDSKTFVNIVSFHLRISTVPTVNFRHSVSSLMSVIKISRILILFRDLNWFHHQRCGVARAQSHHRRQQSRQVSEKK